MDEIIKQRKETIKEETESFFIEMKVGKCNLHDSSAFSLKKK